MPRPAPQLPNLEYHSCICFAAEQPPTKLVHIHFELEVLVAFEDGVFHHDDLMQPEVEILVPGPSLMLKDLMLPSSTALFIRF